MTMITARKQGDHHRHHQCQLPLDAEHHHQRTHDGQGAGEQILRAVVGQLRQFEQVGGQPAHHLTGAVLVVEIEAQLLHVAEQIRRMSASTRMPKV